MISSNPKKEYKGKIEDYPLENYPDYVKGKPAMTEKIWGIDYLDEVERIWCSRWGGKQGIGKLREVALMMPTEHEVNPLWEKDPTFFWRRRETLRLDKLQKAIADLAQILEENDVKVHWMDTTETMGAYGPLRKLYMAARTVVLKGGAILCRLSAGSYVRGNEVNDLRFLTKINCPPILMIIGKGVFGGGCCVPVAEDIVMIGMSLSCNDEGVEQVIPVMRRCGIKEIPIAHLTTIHEDFESGGEYHLDMIFGVLDNRVALIYPGYLDWRIFMWLRGKGFKIIDIPKDEHHNYYPANFVPLEPGKVIMDSRAKETIKRVKGIGIEVIEFDGTGLMAGANGIRCVVLELVRDPGPGLDD